MSQGDVEEKVVGNENEHVEMGNIVEEENERKVNGLNWKWKWNGPVFICCAVFYYYWFRCFNLLIGDDARLVFV